MRGALPSATLDPQGSEATEGVDKTNHYYLDYLSTPSPLRGTRPCLRGRKWMLGHCRNTVITISPRQQTVPLRQVGRGAKRRRGWIKPITARYYLITYPPPPHYVVLTPVPGGESGCSVIAETLNPTFFLLQLFPSLAEGLGESPTFGSRGRVRLAERLGRPSSPLSCSGIGGGAVFRSSFYCMIFCITFGIYGNCITFA